MTLRGVEIRLSEHAVRRFRERVRPGLDEGQARNELSRLVAFGEMVGEPPEWLAATQRQRASCFLVLGDLVLPLDPGRRDREVLCALTCIARGSLSEAARTARSARRSRTGGRRHPAGRRPEVMITS